MQPSLAMCRLYFIPAVSSPRISTLNSARFGSRSWGWRNQDDRAKTPDTSQLGVYENVYSQHYSSIDKNISNLIVPHLYAISDISKEPQLKSLSANFLEASIGSFLAIPLQYGQQCIGCLTIFRSPIETEIVWAGRCSSDTRSIVPESPLQLGKKSKSAKQKSGAARNRS